MPQNCSNSTDLQLPEPVKENKYLRPILENIPTEIKESNQWVNWKAINRNGKITKPPCQPDGQLAKSNDSSTWSSYTAVTEVLDEFNGIGFVLTRNDPYVALDFDNCRCPAFDSLVPWANGLDVVLPEIANHIKKLNSYSEISPSRKGIRILVKGSLTRDGMKKGSIEAYQAVHYVTLTGHVLDGCPCTIKECPEELSSFDDTVFGKNEVSETFDSFDSSFGRNDLKYNDFIEYRKRKMFASKHGEEIQKLWNGDHSYNSHSEADMAMCSRLAFWLDKDAMAMDLAFRMSGLMREKWTEKHYSDGKTYGQVTIEKAIAGCKSVYGDSQTSTSFDWKDPIPLPQLPPVRELDPELIPEPLRGWIMDMAERMQISPDFLAAPAIVAIGSLIGRRCAIFPKQQDDWKVIPNLWGGVIGRPSLMKTPSISEAHRYLHRLEAEARKDHEKAMRIFEEEKHIAEAMISAIKDRMKKAAKTGNYDELEMLKEEMKDLHPEEPFRLRYQTQDATIEKIGEILKQNPNGILVNRDELTGFLKTLDKPGREGDRSFYLESWNGNGRFTYDRIGRGTLDVEAVCLSVFGAVTPGALQSYVQSALNGGSGDDGLIQRFQVMVWPDVKREWSNVDRPPNTEEKNRAWNIYKKLSTLKPETNDQSDDIPALHFSDKGQEVFNQWRNELEIRMRGDHGLPTAMESHLIKYRKLMPSLALIFHLIDYVDGRTESLLVSEEAALRAAAWCEYLETHAMRIYSVVTMTPGMDAAKEIAKHIKQGNIKDGMSIRDIWRPQWSKLTSSNNVKAGLEVLQIYGWLVLESLKTKGRPSTTVRLNPRLKS